MNLADLRRTLGVDGEQLAVGRASSHSHAEAEEDGLYGADNKARFRRLSMERMDLLKVCCAMALLKALAEKKAAYRQRLPLHLAFTVGLPADICVIMHGFENNFYFIFRTRFGLAW